jgi:hypothetical protein
MHIMHNMLNIAAGLHLNGMSACECSYISAGAHQHFICASAWQQLAL